MDRFMLKVLIDYPTKEQEKLIIRQNINIETAAAKAAKPSISTADIMEARKVVGKVYIDEKIEQYIVDLVFATRYPEQNSKLAHIKTLLDFGASPRASINLALAARTYAFIRHREYVLPEDVRSIAHDVLRHRIGLSYEAEAENITADNIIDDIIDHVELP